MNTPITIIGAEGSPYSRKMRAVLRYRNIPYRWVATNGPEYVAPPKVPVEVIPVLVWHDDSGAMKESMVDSTPQIRRFEKEYQERSVLHPDPVLDFLSALIEDYADEWCTKFMFHYRWADEAGIEWARYHLIRQINPSTNASAIEQFSSSFSKRQIGRRWVVGSNETTRPLIEKGYERLLRLMEALVKERLFLFGKRPSSADFALYGQLTQLCLFDPSSRQMARAIAPRVVAWTERLEDLSGWKVTEDQWIGREPALDALKPLLKEIGETYIPFLLANADAKQSGQEKMKCVIQGTAWEQNVFPYQVKCLRWLREQFTALDQGDKAWIKKILADTGCNSLIE